MLTQSSLYCSICRGSLRHSPGCSPRRPLSPGPSAHLADGMLLCASRVVYPIVPLSSGKALWNPLRVSPGAARDHDLACFVYVTRCVLDEPLRQPSACDALRLAETFASFPVRWCSGTLPSTRSTGRPTVRAKLLPSEQVRYYARRCRSASRGGRAGNRPLKSHWAISPPRKMALSS